MARQKAAYHKGNVREGLIAAAEQVLHDEGLPALSLRRLAREVGVAPSAVYNHFENREALLAAVAADGYRQLYNLELEIYSDRGTPEQTLRRVGRRYLRFAADNPNLYRLMFSPDMVPYRGMSELEEAGDDSFGISVDWWYGADSYDPGRSAVNWPYALAVWALVHGAAMQMIDGLVTLDMADSAATDRLADSLLEVFIVGAASGFPEKT